VQVLASALLWAAGLAVVVASARMGHPGWWPERLAGCGLLGAVVVGPATLAGVAFLGLTLAGLLARLAWSARHVARVVLR
jgi:hypothetical protein